MARKLAAAGIVVLVVIIVAAVRVEPPSAAPVFVISPSTPIAIGVPTLPPAWTATRVAAPGPSRTPRPSATPRPTRTPFPPGAWGPTVIGASVEGRPLEVYQFGLGPVRRLIVAGIHGGYEWNTIALADQLIEHLTQHPELVPANVTLYLLRSLNPDGEARGSGEDGRYNAHHVDLNRNFPVDWKYDFRRTGCRDQTPGDAGPYAISEPETRALMQFVTAYQPDALISYHSAALGIFVGGRPPLAASRSLAEAVDLVSTYPYPAIDTGCEYTGQFIDWAASLGIAALDIELSTHARTDFAQNLDIVRVFLNWQQ